MLFGPAFPDLRRVFSAFRIQLNAPKILYVLDLRSLYRRESHRQLVVKIVSAQGAVSAL
jgi:hypothetical protein